MTPTRPRLRQVDAFVQEIEGERVVVMRDPLDVTDAVLVLPLLAGCVLNACNGTRTIEEVAAAVEQEYDVRVDPADIAQLIERLDQHTFLDSPTYHEARTAIETEFAQATLRPAVLAGRSYAAEPHALRTQLDELFTHEDGPGAVPDATVATGTLEGIIAPHIDYGRGSPTYGHSYHAIAEHCNADLFVILGTGHGEVYTQYAATWKDFQTPFGTVPTDKRFLDTVQAHLTFDLRTNELAHRGEHSIEFHAVLLQYLYAQHRPIEIVPILCSSFQPFVSGNASPGESEHVAGMIAGLRTAIQQAKATGKRVCLLASADLAHVGSKFGDAFLVDESQRARISVADLAMLETVVAGDAEAFFQSIQQEQDERRICGFPCIYTMLSAMEPTRGELLQYRQWPDPEDCVTFAGVAFYGAPRPLPGD